MKIDFLEGSVLLINKPYRWTSFDAVNKVRTLIKHKLGIKKCKIGHAGTLDPLATGLLILCTGKFTKKIDEYQAQEKEYTGTFTLGATRPSSDLETEIDATFDYTGISESDIYNAINAFKGTIKQVPPVFSAKKVDGARAYESARKGLELKLEAREVFIREIEITGIRLPEVDFRVICSKGTYIRSLAKDFGEKLQNGAYLSALHRTRIGDFHVNNAHTIEEIEEYIMQQIPHLNV